MVFTAFAPNTLGAPPPGLQQLTGGGVITLATITQAQALGYVGLDLDPRQIWDMSGLVLNGVQNFTIHSRMLWSIGYNGVVFTPTGYIKTDTGSPADGVQIYASSPTGNPTTGLLFQGLVFRGTHSNAAVHLGGGARDIVFEHCLFQNLGSAVGSFGMINDTALSNNNCESCEFFRPGFAGGYGGYGIGIADQANGHVNDCNYYSPKFSAGTYSLQINQGGNHHLYNAYDRSSPSGACFYNHGGGIVLHGNEDLDNTSATGVSHLLDAAGSLTMLDSCNISVNVNPTTITVTNGRLTARNQQRISGTVSVTSPGQVDFSDPQLATAAITLTGTGTARLAAAYANGAAPTFTAWTGTTVYSPAMQQQTANAGFGLQNGTPTILTWTAPADGNAHTVWVGGDVHVTVAETGGVINVNATAPDGAAISSQVDPGAHAAGVFALTTRQFQVQSGSTTTLAQGTALTAGTAVVNASLWGA